MNQYSQINMLTCNYKLQHLITMSKRQWVNWSFVHLVCFTKLICGMSRDLLYAICHPNKFSWHPLYEYDIPEKNVSLFFFHTFDFQFLNMWDLNKFWLVFSNHSTHIFLHYHLLNKHFWNWEAKIIFSLVNIK